MYSRKLIVWIKTISQRSLVVSHRKRTAFRLGRYPKFYIAILTFSNPNIRIDDIIVVT